ncbi:unnamed protein product, partial [marine sediment metagenome]
FPGLVILFQFNPNLEILLLLISFWNRDLDKSQYLMAEANLALPSFHLNVIQGDGLEAIAPPFNISGKVLGSWGMEQEKEIREYIVKSGDTLSSIAASFEISLNTLLWANDLNEKSTINPDQKLIILPVSGVLHIVREKDTLSELAEIYQVDLENIIEFNEIPDEGRICAADTLIIPNGKMPKTIDVKYVKVPLGSTFFLCPIPSPCRITQGLHPLNAVDFSNGKCGEPVFAAAEGSVQRTGYGRRGGIFVRISHPNGVVTYYGHLSGIAVNPGQPVHQGDIIGY